MLLLRKWKAKKWNNCYLNMDIQVISSIIKMWGENTYPMPNFDGFVSMLGFMLVKKKPQWTICVRSHINDDVRASCLIRSRILHTLTLFIRASRANFRMTIATSRVIIPITHGRTLLGLINTVASHRSYLQNTGKIGEITPCLRAAFVVLHIGCANVYVRASSLAPVILLANVTEWTFSHGKYV